MRRPLTTSSLRIRQMSRGMSVSAEAVRITAAAANCVAGTPMLAASGPATSAPTGIAASEPIAS